MFEIAQDFQRAVAGLSREYLIGLGLACTIVGLFVWLGGLGFRKYLAVAVGASAGAVCAFFVAGWELVPVLLGMGGGIAMAVIFEKAFITIMAAGLAAVIAFGVLAKVYEADLTNGLKQACFDMPLYSCIIVAALPALLILLAFYAWRFVSALGCAGFGTLLVFLGMILLLTFKGIRPVTHMYDKSSYYAAVFAGMTAFGTIEQLLLCPRSRGKPVKKQAKKKKEEGEPEPAKQDWRTQ